MMKSTRLVELSLFHIAQNTLSRRRENEKPKSADFKTYNLKYNNIQANYPVIVKVGGEVNLANTINYRDGVVVFNSSLLSSDIVEVSYTYCPINIYDEGISPQSKDFKYPAVAIYELNREDRPYELGNAKKEMNPTWVFEVWCERGGERNDITDYVMEIFEDTLDVIDYNIAFPLNEDGTRNSSFNSENQVIGHMTCDSINYRKGGSLDIGDKPIYLSEIFVDLTINI